MKGRVANPQAPPVARTTADVDSSRSAVQHPEERFRSTQGGWILDADKRDLIEILDKLPCGVAILGSPLGRARYINRQIIETLGYSLPDTPSTAVLERKLHPDRRSRSKSLRDWKQVVEAGGGTSTFDAVCADGAVRTFEHRSVVLRKGLITALWIDITRREAAEAQLRESEPRFAPLFEESNDPFLLFDQNHLINCNLAAQHLLDRWNKAELLTMTLQDLSAERQRDGRPSSVRAPLLLRAASKHGSLRSEWRMKRRDGTEVDVELSIAVVAVNEKSLFFMVARDITSWKEEHTALLCAKRQLERKVRERTSELVAVNDRLRAEIRTRKITERQLRRSREELRRLSEHLQQTREVARTNLAREVHDQLGQSLAALKIDLAEVREGRWEPAEGLEAKVRGIEGQVNEIMRSVREICKELRPPVFDDFGISSAVRWYLSEFEKRSGIACEAIIDEELSYQKTDGCLVMFRILQEAMSNVLRHARARKVRVTVQRAGDNLRLEVTDDGIGITAAQTTDPRSLGILGIRERVRFRGGKLSLKGSPGKGTRMIVSIPMGDETRPGCDRREPRLGSYHALEGGLP
ncbi:MAG: PAS domain-containing sensor histidine kinase [Deltaproteobacteria bacterium]|nr:PAS domain-containing sensor histidine kinase [Deltaproteobacteria bacterium]